MLFRITLLLNNVRQFFCICVFFVHSVWDVNNECEIKLLEFSNIPNSLELSRDGAVLVVTSGCVTSFWNTET